MDGINALIGGFGAILECCKIVKETAMKMGFSESEAFEFTKDYFHLQTAVIIRKASYGDE